MENAEHALLERVHQEKGEQACRALFQEECRTNPSRASAMLNAQGLGFPTVHLLLPLVRQNAGRLRLSGRSQMLLRLTRQLAQQGKSPLLSGRNSSVKNLLIWAVETGWRHEGDAAYDELMDRFLCVLLLTYREQRVQKVAVDLLFARERQGKNMHALCWACFGVHRPEMLRLVAEHIRGEDLQEQLLADSLLHTQRVCRDCENDRLQRHKQYIRWLEENDAYLYFTGESMQLCGDPIPCKVDLERKFLCVKPGGYESLRLTRMPVQHRTWLEGFRHRCREDRELLSACSQRLRKKDLSVWQAWMALDMEEKLSAAKQETEGWE